MYNILTNYDQYLICLLRLGEKKLYFTNKIAFLCRDQTLIRRKINLGRIVYISIFNQIYRVSYRALEYRDISKNRLYRSPLNENLVNIKEFLIMIQGLDSQYKSIHVPLRIFDFKSIPLRDKWVKIN